MANATPTFVIGVGGAGISVLNTLDETVKRKGVEEKFEYVAVDSHGVDLRRAPEDASKINLQKPSDFVDADRERYPYLTQDMEIPHEGTYRQRPVGRYMIDNIANYEEVFEEISDAVEEFYEKFENDLEPTHFNVLLVNSLAGGTGSGTLPLLSAIVSESIDLSIANADTDIYFAGVGMVPELTKRASIARKSINTYACLNDISKLLGADTESEFGVPVYSQMYGDGADDSESWVLGIPESPFDSYWLFGTAKKESADGGERHRVQNRATSEQILSLSLLEMSPEDWARDPAPSVSKLGTMESSEIYVPHERIESLCELKEELRDKKKALTDEIKDIEKVQERKHRLERLRNDPESVEEIYEDGHEYREIAREALEETLGEDEEKFEVLDLRISIETDEGDDGKPDIEPLFRERTPEEYAEALETIRDGYDIKVQMVAIQELESILTAQDAAPAVREAFDEMVARWWEEFGMEIAGEGYEHTVYDSEARLEYLKQYLTKEIEKIEKSLEERSEEEGAIESLLKTPLRDIEYMIPQQILRGEWERLRLYRRVKSALVEAESDVRKMDRILDTVESERNSIKDEMREEAHELEREIDEIDRKEGKIRNRIDELERQISSEEKRLHEWVWSENRVELPLNEDMLNEMGADTVAEMDSLKDYIENGLIEKSDLREALNEIMAESIAWDSPVIDRDVSRVEGNTSSRDEIWALSHEDNEDYLSAAYHAMKEQNVGGAEGREHIDAPYSIRIFSYTNRGPVEALESYQTLEDMAENERLDEISGHDEQSHRLSFAYPEWYGDDVREAFGIDTDREFSYPPEPENLKEGKIDDESK